MNAPAPLARQCVLALLDHDAVVMKAALFGGELISPDVKLENLTTCVGILAASLASGDGWWTQDYLKRVFGLAAGWLMQIGERHVQNVINAECERLEKLFPGDTCAVPEICPRKKLRVLVLNLGEVACQIDNLENSAGKRIFLTNLREKLVQVAAVAVAWLESLATTKKEN